MSETYSETIRSLHRSIDVYRQNGDLEDLKESLREAKALALLAVELYDEIAEENGLMLD